MGNIEYVIKKDFTFPFSIFRGSSFGISKTKTEVLCTLLSAIHLRQFHSSGNFRQPHAALFRLLYWQSRARSSYHIHSRIISFVHNSSNMSLRSLAPSISLRTARKRMFEHARENKEKQNRSSIGDMLHFNPRTNMCLLGCAGCFLMNNSVFFFLSSMSSLLNAISQSPKTIWQPRN